MSSVNFTNKKGYKMKYIIQSKKGDCFIMAKVNGDYVADTILTADISKATVFTNKAEAQRVKTLTRYHNIKTNKFEVVKLEPIADKTLIKIYQGKAVYLMGDAIIVENIPLESREILDFYKKIPVNDFIA